MKEPYGQILSRILENLPAVPATIGCEEFGDKAVHLMQICIALQAYHGAEPFFLSCRKAGELIGLHFTDASKLLVLFVSHGWLRLIKAGDKRTASRYMAVVV